MTTVEDHELPMATAVKGITIQRHEPLEQLYLTHEPTGYVLPVRVPREASGRTRALTADTDLVALLRIAAEIAHYGYDDWTQFDRDLPEGPSQAFRRAVQAVIHGTDGP